MQRASTPLSTPSMTNQPHRSLTTKFTLALLTAGMLSLTGCQTFKNLTGGDKDTVATAEKSDAKYYQDAMESLKDERYVYASEQLAELRTFYPTGAYSQQALLDLMYSQFQSKEYELAALSAEEFIKLYPSNSQIDYAYYVRGVANMQAANNTILNLAKLNPAHRDTSYQRLAFSNFQELLARFPNSSYAPDAAQRMTFIYNQFAESELAAARWYIKRGAYVAAANRAKWVFQYYPLSEQTPEAIAILAYTNEQLGLTDLAKQYKTLLQINYPEWLTQNGQVRLDRELKGGLLNKITFGVLGRAVNEDESSAVSTTQYTGATKQQVIYQARQLQLPDDNAVSSQSSMPTISTERRGIRLGLGLPEDANSATRNTQSQPTPSRVISPSEMYPADNTPIMVEPDLEAEPE